MTLASLGRRCGFLAVLVLLGMSAVAAPVEVMRLKGHADAVMGAAFSPDGKLIATCSVDKTARLWDAATGSVVRRFEGHADTVTSVAFSSDGTRLVTGSIDRTARVWDVKTGALLAQLAGAHDLHVHAVAIAPDGTRVLTGSCDATAVLWDVASEKPIGKFGHGNEVWAVGFAPDGKSFFVGNQGDQGRTGTCLRLYAGDGAKPPVDYTIPPVRGATFVDNGKGLLVNAGSAFWHVDIASGKLRETKRPGTGGPSMTVWAPSPDGRFALMADVTSVHLVSVETGRNEQEFAFEFRDEVRAVAISPDGTIGVIGGGGRGNPWDAPNGFSAPTNTDVRVVRLRPVGAAVATTQGSAPRFRREMRGPNGGMIYPPNVLERTSPDGKYVLTINTLNSIAWWDAKTGAIIGGTGGAPKSNGFTIAPDSCSLASADPAGNVFITDVKHPWPPTLIIPSRGYEIGQIAFDDDAEGLTVSFGARAEPPKPDAKGPLKAGAATAPAPAPPTGDPFVVLRWDLEARRQTATYTGARSPARSFATANAGKVLVAMTDGLPDAPPTLHAWDAASGAALWAAPVLGVSPRRDVHQGIRITPDGSVGIWWRRSVAGVFDARTGKTIATLDRQKREIGSAAFDPDGKRVWVLAVADAVRAYDRSTGAVLKTVSLGGEEGLIARYELTPKRRVVQIFTRERVWEDLDLGD